jgi:hypothetical protein
VTSADAEERELADLGAELASGLVAALPGWARSNVERVGHDLGRHPDDIAATAGAAVAALEERLPNLADELAALARADVDEQRTTPLAVVREAVGPVSDVLRARSWPPVRRDEWAQERFPDDPYDLTPGHVGDVDPSLFETAVAWGAAKAWLHRRRHRRRRVVVCAGMIDASRIHAEAGRLDSVDVVTTADAAALAAALAAAPADLVLVDLTRRGALDAAAGAGTRRVGFGPHVDDELLRAATTAGVEATARSVFFRRLPELLAGPDRTAGHEAVRR